MHVTLTRRLGFGNQGEAWLTECGNVLKATREDEEVIIAHHLRVLQKAGIKFQHFPVIHAICRFEGGGYGILRSEIPDIRGGDDFDNLLDDLNEGWTFGRDRYLERALTESETLRSVHRDLVSFRDRTGIRIIDLGNPDNLGGSLETPVLRDIGQAEDVRTLRVEDVEWDEVLVTLDPDIPVQEAGHEDPVFELS